MTPRLRHGPPFVARVVAVLPNVALAVLLSVVVQLGPRAVLPITVALLPAFVRRRFAITPRMQLVLAGITLGAGIAIATTYPPPLTALHGALATVAYPLAPAALLFATARRFLSNPAKGEGGTLAVGLTGVLICGYGQARAIYPAFVVLYFVLAALALRAADPARPKISALGARHRAAFAVIVATGGALAGGLALSLGPLYERALNILVLGEQGARTGFQEGAMQLGSLAGMDDSDEVALRVFGARPDGEGDAPRFSRGLLLRGAVFRAYRHGEWAADASDRVSEALPVSRAEPIPEPSVRMELERGDTRRLFLPLDAKRVHVDGLITADTLGILRRDPSGPMRIWFSPGAREMLPVASPTPVDLAVPAHLVAPLAAIVARWAGDAGSPAQQLDAILARLEADYVYSRTFKRTPGRDPTLDFLTTTKAGHCEYFASALALLARAGKIPARVVTGYRVSERSPLFGYHIVRERHAHAWVEAYLPERGWVTLDPSPAVSVEPQEPRQTALAAALWDFLGVLPGAIADFVAARSSAERWGAPIVLIAALLFRRWLRLRGERAAGRFEGIDDAPAVYVALLLDALAQRGIERDRSEPIERLAARLSAMSESMPREAGDLLGRCAALRYGGIGDAKALRRDIDRFREKMEER